MFHICLGFGISVVSLVNFFTNRFCPTSASQKVQLLSNMSQTVRSLHVSSRGVTEAHAAPSTTSLEGAIMRHQGQRLISELDLTYFSSQFRYEGSFGFGRFDDFHSVHRLAVRSVESLTSWLTHSPAPLLSLSLSPACLSLQSRVSYRVAATSARADLR